METDETNTETETSEAHTPAPVVPPADPTVVKTAEEWAHELGHLPHFKPGVPPEGKPKKVMPKVWNPKFRLYQGAKNAHTWPIGKELTKAEYEKAVHAAAHEHVFR